MIVNQGERKMLLDKYRVPKQDLNKKRPSVERAWQKSCEMNVFNWLTAENEFEIEAALIPLTVQEFKNDWQKSIDGVYCKLY